MAGVIDLVRQGIWIFNPVRLLGNFYLIMILMVNYKDD